MTKFGYGFIIFYKKSIVVDGKQSSLIDVVSGVSRHIIIPSLIFTSH